MAKITKNDVLSYLENSNMLEISELIKDIEEKFDVSAAAPVAVAGVAAPAAGDAVAEAKSDFDIEKFTYRQRWLTVCFNDIRFCY